MTTTQDSLASARAGVLREREERTSEMLARAVAMLEDVLTEGAGRQHKRWAQDVQDLVEQHRLLPKPMGGEKCPVCTSEALMRLPADWQDRAHGDGWAVREYIPIVGCGNPWHYATASVGDDETNLPDDVVSLGRELAAARSLLLEGVEAVRLMRVGHDYRPPVQGWSWFDWCTKVDRMVLGASEASQAVQP